MSDEVLGMATLAPSLPPLLRREGLKFLGTLCCGKAQWILFEGKVLTACPDHPPMFDFKRLEL